MGKLDEKIKVKMESTEWYKKLNNNVENDLFLEFSIRNLSSMKSLLSSSPINYNEGESLNLGYFEFFKYFKQTIIRFKRIIGQIAIFRHCEYYLFEFKYYRFSILMLYLGSFLILFMTLDNIMAYVLFIFIFLWVYN